MTHDKTIVLNVSVLRALAKHVAAVGDRSEGQYNFSYFSQCHKVASEASRRAKSSVSLYVCQNGVSGGALVSSPGCENFMAVVMPLNPEPMFDAAPHWAFHVDASEAGNKSAVEISP